MLECPRYAAKSGIGVDEAAKVFDVARQTLWRAIRLGNLPSIRYAHRVFIKKEDILEWKEKHYRVDQAKKRKTQV